MNIFTLLKISITIFSCGIFLLLNTQYIDLRSEVDLLKPDTIVNNAHLAKNKITYF